MNGDSHQSSHTTSTDAGADDGEAGCSISVTLSSDCEDSDQPDSRWFTDTLTRAAGLSDVAACELSYVLVNDDRMAELHTQYSGVAGTTDVLTFDLTDPGGVLEAEIYLCIDEARRCAAARGHDLKSELMLYAVHGLLHLLDYDDRTPADADRMHAREDALLELLGLGRIYERPESGGGR